MMERMLWKSRRGLWFGKQWTFTKYTLTNEKIYIDTGIMNLTSNEVSLYRVIDKRLMQTFQQRLFGIGTIILDVTDKESKLLKLENIRNPKKVYRLIDRAVSLQKTKYNVQGKEIIGVTNNI